MKNAGRTCFSLKKVSLEHMPLILLGPLLGLAIFIFVYGPSILLPGNIAWLLHDDPASHYLGFAFYRNSGWQWPLGAIPDLGYPAGSSLVYTDSIPFLAILAKAFDWALPRDFQYFGVWMLACYVLQGYYAQRIFSRFGLQGVALVGAILLVVLSPALALRAYGHESLMAHWLVLASMDAALSGRSVRQRWLLLLAIGIHPYFVPMILPFAAYTWWRNRSLPREVVLMAALSFPLMVAAGYFAGNVGSKSAEGYGYYSANMLTFLDPMDWRQFLAFHGRVDPHAREWSVLLPALGQSAHGQYEGFAYLGAGAIAVVLAAGLLVFLPRRRPGAPVLVHLVLIALVMFVYALSDHIGWGGREIFAFDVPEPLRHLFGVFRASGRFVWPLAMLVPVCAVVVLAARLPARVLATVMALAALLQLYDLHGKHEEFRHRFRPGGLAQSPAYADPVWNQVARYRHLVVLPAAVNGDDWIVPALFAARHGQTLNIVYSARTDTAKVGELQESRLGQLGKGIIPDSDTAYLLRDPALPVVFLPKLREFAAVVVTIYGTFILPDVQNSRQMGYHSTN